VLALIAAIGSLLALVTLATGPRMGVLLLFIIRPLVDTTWGVTLVGSFKLTEVVSAAVPLIVLLRMLLDDPATQPVRGLPLRWWWFLWSGWVVIFATEIMFTQSARDGTNILFRHLNGLAGCYLLQAYCRDAPGLRRLALALLVAGVFPVFTGLIEIVTGHHWRVTYGEDGIVRNIGFYHDAITIRYYALQTLMGVMLATVTTGAGRAVWRTLLVAYGLGAAVVVMGAYSKSGLGVLAVWMLMWLVLRRKWVWLSMAAAAGALAATYYGARIMHGIGFVFKKELGALHGQFSLQQTLSGRWFLWSDIVQRWSQLPLARRLFGSGEVALGAHNDYLQVLMHGGIVGLAIYVLLLLAIAVSIARALARAATPLAVMAAMAFIMWLVDTAGLVPSAYSGYQWFVWGIVALGLRQSGGITVASPAVAPAPGLRASPPHFANVMT